MTNTRHEQPNTSENAHGSLLPARTQESVIATTLFAQPYNPEASGFFFHSASDFENKAECLQDLGGNKVEEFEIQFIDGKDAELFEACRIDPSNLSIWFDDIEEMHDDQKAALYFLITAFRLSLDEAMRKVNHVSLFRGDAKSAARELFDEHHAPAIPENLRGCFDMDKFAHDYKIGGDFREFRFGGRAYTCTNGNCL